MATQSIGGRTGADEPVSLGVLLLASLTLVTGVLVAAAFLLPRTVGALISGRALLAVGLTFVGSVLAALALLPPADQLGSVASLLTTRTTTAAGDPRDTAAETATADTGERAMEADASERAMEADASERATEADASERATETDRLARLRAEVDPAVLYPGVSLAGLVVVAFLLVPEQTRAAVGLLERLVFTTGSELLLGSVLVFVAAAVVVAVGPWGRVKLGGEEAVPEFSDRAYVAMLFSAGIAAGIVFWGPAEAMLHYGTVPPFLDVQQGSRAAVVGALQYTLFHWGVSAWSTYLVVGLPVAYAAYNLDAPLRISSVLVPLLGDGVVERPIGRLVDVLAVVATLGGLSTTMGFLSSQFLTGIQFRWEVTLGTVAELTLVAGLTGILAVSVRAGVDRGMRRFAALNALAFLVVLGGILLVGPTGFVVGTGSRAVAGYVTEFVPMSLYTGGGEWLSAWTVFYWAWWLSWSPFVGLFLARISRGRRVRTVVLAAVGATSLATLTWFVTVGATALSLQRRGVVDIPGVISEVGVAAAGYPLFDVLPAGDVLLVVFLLLVVTFFITSGDAATHSLAELTTRPGRPSGTLELLLVCLVGVIAAVLLTFGGRGTVRSAAVVTGGPFALVALTALVGFAVALRNHEF